MPYADSPRPWTTIGIVMIISTSESAWLIALYAMLRAKTGPLVTGLRVSGDGSSPDPMLVGCRAEQDIFELSEAVRPGPFFCDRGLARSAQGGGPLPVAGQQLDGVPQGGSVRVGQEGRDAIDDGVPVGAFVDRDHRRPARHRFQGGQAEGLQASRANGRDGRAIPIGECRFVELVLDRQAHAALAGQAVERRRIGAARP